MHMLRHDYVTHHTRRAAPPHLLQNLDGDGKRVEKASGSPLTANKFYWYGTDSDPVLESDASGNELYRYFRFQGLLVAREEANPHWIDHYGLDALGNVRWLYSNNGAWDVIDYYPFGGERLNYSTSPGNNTRLFTGKERDSESGLDNFEARYNSSAMGRFMSPDPEQIDGLDHMESPQAWNGYAYVHNNPLNATDPDGLDCIYISNGTGKYEGFNRGDCDNSTEEKANSGYYVNGTVDTINLNGQGQVTGYNGTGDDSGTLIAGTFLSPSPSSGNPDQLSPFALGVLSQPVLKNAAGAVNDLGMLEYRAAGFIFPLSTLLIDAAVGADQAASAAQAGLRRKPGSLGEFKGTDALRRENKMARDIMKELNLGEDAKALVHEALSEGAKDTGREAHIQGGPCCGQSSARPAEVNVSKDSFSIDLVLRHPSYNLEKIAKVLSIKPRASLAADDKLAGSQQTSTFFHARLYKGKSSSEYENALDRCRSVSREKCDVLDRFHERPS
jgi:RHS repeat-associated protein